MILFPIIRSAVENLMLMFCELNNILMQSIIKNEQYEIINDVHFDRFQKLIENLKVEDTIKIMQHKKGMNMKSVKSKLRDKQALKLIEIKLIIKYYK